MRTGPEDSTGCLGISVVIPEIPQNPFHHQSCRIAGESYVSLRLRVQNAVPAQPCVGKLGISLVLLNLIALSIFDYGLKLHKLSNAYPCHASEMTRNTLNHCLKFALRSIFCHICYRKISEKSFSTVIKDKLLVCKASNSYFKGLDFFQMLLASHR